VTRSVKWLLLALALAAGVASGVCCGAAGPDSGIPEPPSLTVPDLYAPLPDGGPDGGPDAGT
jgi:hypothetical protein